MAASPLKEVADPPTPFPSGAVAYRVEKLRLGWLSALGGVASGLLGIGGGIIKVPVLKLAMEVPMRVAVATSNFMVGIDRGCQRTGLHFRRVRRSSDRRFGRSGGFDGSECRSPVSFPNRPKTVGSWFCDTPRDPGHPDTRPSFVDRVDGKVLIR